MYVKENEGVEPYVLVGYFNILARPKLKPLLSWLYFVSAYYRIAQNSGGVKLWRIGNFKSLAGENFGELQ